MYSGIRLASGQSRKPDSLYPVWQNLRAKTESHQLEFRPKETSRLQAKGKLSEVLDQRTQDCWNSLVDCRKAGMNQNEAEEVALHPILLPDERAEARERRSRPAPMDYE